MKSSITFVLIIAALCVDGSHYAQTYRTEKGVIQFVSSANLESIKASSQTMKGAVDLSRQNFAFNVDVNTFSGFNSALQAEHFRENYMETASFPRASFSGKLIDPIQMDKNVQMVRAKGVLLIHGVGKDRIIDIELTKTNTGYRFNSSFNVALDDHKIVIPKLVHQKIAEIIAVKVDGTLVE